MRATGEQMERAILAAGGDPAEHPVPSKYATAEQMERLIAAAEKIGDVKSALIELGLTETVSANLLNPDEVEAGRITSSSSEVLHTGTYDTDYRTTGYMPVVAGKKYGFHILNNNNDVVGVAVSNIWAYKPNKTALSYLGNIAYNADGLSYITAPTDAAYIRASLSTANFTTYGTVMFSEVDGISKPDSIVSYGETVELSKYAKVPWIGRKWVCVGDSLTQDNAATTKHYFDYISDESGITIYNMGVGGTGYARGYDSNRAFYQRISSVPTDADIVTVFGSGNDMNIAEMSIFDGKTWAEALGIYTDTGTETICGCVNTLLDNFFAVMSTVPIGIIAPTPWKGYPTTLLSNNRMDDYVSALKQIAEYRGVPFLDLYHHSNLRPENEANRNACFYGGASLDDNGDGVHPNELGHKIIAPKIYEFVKTLLLN